MTGMEAYSAAKERELGWEKTEIEKKASNTRTANELRNKVNYFIKNHEKNYKNFLKEKIKLNKKHEKSNLKTKKIIKKLVQR